MRRGLLPEADVTGVPPDTDEAREEMKPLWAIALDMMRDEYGNERRAAVKLTPIAAIAFVRHYLETSRRAEAAEAERDWQKASAKMRLDLAYSIKDDLLDAMNRAEAAEVRAEQLEAERDDLDERLYARVKEAEALEAERDRLAARAEQLEAALQAETRKTVSVGIKAMQVEGELARANRALTEFCDWFSERFPTGQNINTPSPQRRLDLYLGIARRLRPLGPVARGARHAAVEQAWQARHDLFVGALHDLLDRARR